MRRESRRLLWLGATAVLGALSIAVVWAPRPAGHAAFAPRPSSRELRDLGVACLALGELRPGLAELSDPDLEALVEILARLVGAYERGDFESFLALRVGDLATAARMRSADLESLRAIARELAIPLEELRGDWIDVLGAFWEHYYARPPVARFVPEGARIELREEALDGRSLESWNDSFEALRDRVPGPWIQHELAIPHRRAIGQVARAVGPLRWIDIELPFETHEGLAARLVARFVWDGVVREWFLHDAASVYSPGDRSQRHLIL